MLITLLRFWGVVIDSRQLHLVHQYCKGKDDDLGAKALVQYSKYVSYLMVLEIAVGIVKQQLICVLFVSGSCLTCV